MATLEVIPGDPFYPTFAAAWALANNNDFILGNAVGAATTYYDEVLTNLTGKTGVTIGVHAGDEGLIVVRPVTNQTYIWRIDTDNITIQDIYFHHGWRSIARLIEAYNGDNALIRRCDFRVTAVSDMCIESNAYDVTGWVIEDCDFFGGSSGVSNYGHGIKCDHLTAVEISRCTFYSLQQGVGYAYSAIIDRCWFDGRATSTNSYGVYRLRDSAVLTNSIIFDTMYAVHCDAVCTTGGVFNNVMYNCDRAITTGAGSYPFALDNNAMVNCNVALFGNASWGPAPDCNLFYNNGTDVISYTAPVHSQTTDPLFTDGPGHDFTWVAGGGSPLEDNGKPLPGVVNFDFIGTARPQGAGWDIGPYEIVASGWGHTFLGGPVSSVLGVTNPSSVMGV